MASQARSKARPPLHEFDLIRALQQRHGRGGRSIIQGIGDDAAIVIPPRGQWSLLTTDLLTEGIHFDLKTATLADIGYRATAANLSDIAAMGGRPCYLLAALAVPRRGTSRQVHQLYQGMMAACRPAKVKLIGGDTSASDHGWFVSLTVVGEVPTGRALQRHGARIGDRIYVTGTLGDSLAGLRLLQESSSARQLRPAMLSASHRRFLIQRHLRPIARVREGQWLRIHRYATSAIDLSDGLSGDLRHICEASHVGAEIDPAAIPLSSACRAFANAHRFDPTALALKGGEDYELLFTGSARKHAALERAARKAGMRIACIGTITSARSGIQTIGPNGKRRPLPITSYEHFQ
jgi:thiamine-monophosphate kinase